MPHSETDQPPGDCYFRKQPRLPDPVTLASLFLTWETRTVRKRHRTHRGEWARRSSQSQMSENSVRRYILSVHESCLQGARSLPWVSHRHLMKFQCILVWFAKKLPG